MENVEAKVLDMEIQPDALGVYRLMTAEIVFAEEDTGEAAVTWRDYDVTPGFPRLRAFIDRWRDDPDLRVRSVTVTEIAGDMMPACRVSPYTTATH